ncbi:MAG: glycoside hydrolase family 2 TIM barrel-domain containing protein [Candidatus Thermoplasmatota archaeon]|nr:glycoside hydrolase family 2 TIM barrel-domain containing protein [Candidatus Thermoplasmatota archaeon]
MITIMKLNVMMLFLVLLLPLPIDPKQQNRERIDLQDWRMYPSKASGKEISRRGFDDSEWYDVSVPTTVLAGLVQNGIYEDLYKDKNLAKVEGFQDILWRTEEMPEDSPFRDPWWFRTSFRSESKKALLHLDGINYRADVWLNGEQIAKDIVGPYKRFEIDVVLKRDNYLAVKIYPPEGVDPTFAWVDWNPTPPDRGMGLWREAYLTFNGPLRIEDVQVITDVLAESAEISINVELLSTDKKERACTLKGDIKGVRNSACNSDGDPRVISFSKDVVVGPEGKLRVSLDSKEFAQLNVSKPLLWWPNNYGKQDLYSLNLEILTSEGISDKSITRFGIKEVSSYLNDEGWRGFRVNGGDILIRGGGYVDDMLLRPSNYKDEVQILYARDMNLNALRMEGIWGSDYLYDLCDEQGILLFVGLCCCSPWERWENWTEETKAAAIANFEDSVLRLRNHPSIICWMYGSDRCPPPDIEKEYLSIVKGQDGTRPFLSSATEYESPLTGKTGMKMRGPYDYVPPVYYYEDKELGGAFGFGTEEGFGPSVPPLESMERMLSHPWPPDDTWDFHSGRGQFSNISVYDEALNRRYGKADSIDDYCRKAQLMNYESARAQLEAWGRNRYEATGVILWRFNQAWPSLIWQLFDYYLVQGGAYYGAKKGCEPLHIQYSYDDRSVCVVNLYQSSFALKAGASIYTAEGKKIWEKEEEIIAGPDSTTRVFSVPEQSEDLYFLSLTLEGEGFSGSNFYWLSKKEDVMDYKNSTWYYTPAKEFADFTKLRSLDEVELKVTAEREAEKMCMRIKNPSDNIALFITIRAFDGESTVPSFWSDNCISLLPGEERLIEGSITEGSEVIIEGYNCGQLFIC